MTRAPHRPARRDARPLAAALALAAGAGLAGCATGTDVQPAAATAAAPVATFFSSTGGTAAARSTAAPVSPEVSLRPALPPVADSLVVPFVPIGTPPVLDPRPDPCGGYATPRTITPGVVAGTGSAVVSWTADNRTEVQGYRVQAVDVHWATSEQQRPPVVVETGQRTDCGEISATVTGLVPGDPYVFWLDERLTSATVQGTHYVQVGASERVVVG